MVKSTGSLTKVLCPRSPQTLDVRLGFSLCPAEQEFLQKRKVVAAKALQQVLQLEEGLSADEVGKQRPASRGFVPLGAELVLPTTHPASRPRALLCPRVASPLPFLGAQLRAVLDVIQLCVCKGKGGEGKVERERKGPRLLLPMHQQVPR